MKKIVFGYHPEDRDKKIYFWDRSEFNDWEARKYMVVETSRGLQVAKVVGDGEITDEECEYASKKVVHFFGLKED